MSARHLRTFATVLAVAAVSTIAGILLIGTVFGVVYIVGYFAFGWR